LQLCLRSYIIARDEADCNLDLIIMLLPQAIFEIMNDQPYHNNRNHALTVRINLKMGINSTSISITGSNGHHQGPLFPGKLFQMLQYIDLHASDLAHIVSWQPHGRCFHVHDPKGFEKLVLPRFFETMTRYASFLRQLKLWGFRCLAQNTPDQGAFYNEMFLRSKVSLSHRISRNLSKSVRQAPRYYPGAGNVAAVLADAVNEPDFYLMVDMPPSSEGITAHDDGDDV
jgi:hypothetical protein